MAGYDSPVKVCSKCKVEKPLGAFGRHKGKGDGLRSQCKDCTNTANAQYKTERPELIDQRNALYREQNRELINGRNRIRRVENSNQVLAIEAAYRERNREHLREYQTQWKEENRDHLNAYARNYYKVVGNPSSKRRVLLAGVESDGSNRTDVWQKSAGACHICGQHWEPLESWHVDHIMPLSKGGTDLLTNKAVACPRCNSRKGNQVPVCS